MRLTAGQAPEEPASIIRDQVGPSFAALRPGKPPTTPTFPVYPKLTATMANGRLAHPDETLAQVLATCAGYAYSDVGTVAMMMTRMGLENNLCREISRSVDAMLIRATAHLIQSSDGQVVIVAFRGTPPLDLVSWFLDADLYPEKVAAAADHQATSPEPYEVHAGFYRNVRMIRHELIRALQNALEGKPVIDATTDGTFPHVTSDAPGPEARRGMKPLKALYLTGHSLGGAMAAIMATMLVMNESYRELAGKLRGVYTFGQPMVGSHAFAEHAQNRLHQAGAPLVRFVYGKDPVPELPPKITGDFAHFGDEYHVKLNEGWEASNNSQQLELVGGLVTAFASFGLTKFVPLRGLPFRRKLEDHFPHHYVTSLIAPGRPDEFGDYFMQQPD
jgi:hypothetical protein